jgi:hypothetical protein
VRWRLDPPIEDPTPVTRQRVLAFAVAMASAGLSLVMFIRAFDIALSENLHFWLGGAFGLVWLASSRSPYASTLARLDDTQLHVSDRRSVVVADSVGCAFVATAFAWLAGTKDPWLWLGSAGWLLLAGDELRLARGLASRGAHSSNNG